MTRVIAVHAKQLNPQPDGTVTVSIVYPTDLQCQNPDRPAQIGDVLSVTPDGDLVARPAGTAAAWEKAKIVGASLVYAPQGAAGIAVILPYAAEIPNV